jgi:hypothetical protein
VDLRVVIENLNPVLRGWGVETPPEDSERQIGHNDFIRLVLTEEANARQQSSAGEPDLHDVVVQVDE